MTQYNSLSVKLSNPQLEKLISVTKTLTMVTFRLSVNILRNNDIYFSQNVFFHIRKSFSDNSSGSVNLLETQISKNNEIGRFLRSVIEIGLPLIKNALPPIT